MGADESVSGTHKWIWRKSNWQQTQLKIGGFLSHLSSQRMFLELQQILLQSLLRHRTHVFFRSIERTKGLSFISVGRSSVYLLLSSISAFRHLKYLLAVRRQWGMMFGSWRADLSSLLSFILIIKNGLIDFLTENLIKNINKINLINNKYNNC